jgi:hypothetical protein
MDRQDAITTAAKTLNEAEFVNRYKSSFLVFARPTDELTTATELALSTVSVPVESATAVHRTPPTPDETKLLEHGFFLEPVVSRWPAELSAVVTVGRARGNDLFFPDHTVSKIHALFRTDEEGVMWLFDPGSKNGTFVGTERLRMGMQHRLEDSELVAFGGIKALFKRPAALHAFLRRAAERPVKAPLDSAKS